ncbi:CLUMA_CG008822, isoform A [Clunio marinus]|uniref:CLUMA_CG008822, isoform A n=1 Tax=Clunio marinus TaxID=568069 RepID=A0A1J1I9X0_9DIPT|nr:CLUMA_CG008822, isoform A [Clunio marinus]
MLLNHVMKQLIRINSFPYLHSDFITTFFIKSQTLVKSYVNDTPFRYTMLQTKAFMNTAVTC